MVSKLQHGNKNSAYFLTSYENYIHHKRILESMNPNTLAENSNSHVNGRLLEWFTYKSKVDSFQLPKKKRKEKEKPIALTIPVVQTVFGLRCLLQDNIHGQVQEIMGMKFGSPAGQLDFYWPQLPFQKHQCHHSYDVNRFVTLISTLVWCLLHLQTSS